MKQWTITKLCKHCQKYHDIYIESSKYPEMLDSVTFNCPEKNLSWEVAVGAFSPVYEKLPIYIDGVQHPA